ncbi:MAG: hypothetical protein Q8Q47_09975 [Ignavibacteriaceae bacterium]|nr:hypothetical protein [Ignavibacteriaceae bacterium]
MNKVKFYLQFLFVAATLLFHLYLLIKMTVDERYILSGILLIPVSIFSIRINKMIKQKLSEKK